LYWFDPEDARQWVERELAKPRQAQAPNNRKFLYALLAWIHGVAGRLTEAQATREQAKDLWVGGLHAPPLEFWAGQWEETVKRHGPVRDRYLEMGNFIEACVLDRWRAEAARLTGDIAAARQVQDAVLTVRPGHRSVGPLIHLDAALTEFESDRPAEGRNHIEAARAMVADPDDWRGVAGRLAVAEALSEAARDNLSGAETSFEDAITVFRRLGLPWEEAEAFLLWGRTLTRKGDASRAAERFDAAAGVYRRCQAPPRWLQRLAAERSE
jgi:tetratricopeptide (TPR) repeat protein